MAEKLLCEQEIGNSFDALAITVMKRLDEEDNIVGHLPRRISSLCSAFLRQGGTIKCKVDRHKQYSEDLPQGRFPCKLVFEIESLRFATKPKG